MTWSNFWGLYVGKRSAHYIWTNILVTEQA